MSQSQMLASERPAGPMRFMLIPVLLLVAGSALLLLGEELHVDAAAVVILGVTTLLALLIFNRASRNELHPAAVFQVLVLAWIVKLASIVFKLYLVFSVYGGSVDAVGYHTAGIGIAEDLLAGNLPDLTHFWGTSFIENATGVLYLITTPTMVGGWIVWAFLGSMGMLLYYKAFVTAFPDGNRSLYMWLVFFAPSVVIWTNALGKDAIMAFFIGMAAYGTALVHRRGLYPGSVLWTLVGLAGVMLVRPHLAAIVAVALAAVIFLRPIRAGILTPIIRLATIAGIVALAVVVVRTSASFVGVEDLSVEGVTGFLETEQEQSAQGGSVFEGGFPTNPYAFLNAVVTVLFRPFPWEAGGALAMASALEGVGLIFLALWRFRSVSRAIGGVRRNPYLAFTVAYAAMFIFFFSTISNFGLLARQRVQLLPFVFVWLAYLGPSRAEDHASLQG